MESGWRRSQRSGFWYCNAKLVFILIVRTDDDKGYYLLGGISLLPEELEKDDPVLAIRLEIRVTDFKLERDIAGGGSRHLLKSIQA
jgi:hypothetical protein